VKNKVKIKGVWLKINRKRNEGRCRELRGSGWQVE